MHYDCLYVVNSRNYSIDQKYFCPNSARSNFFYLSPYMHSTVCVWFWISNFYTEKAYNIMCVKLLGYSRWISYTLCFTLFIMAHTTSTNTDFRGSHLPSYTQPNLKSIILVQKLTHIHSPCWALYKPPIFWVISKIITIHSYKGLAICTKNIVNSNNKTLL